MKKAHRSAKRPAPRRPTPPAELLVVDGRAAVGAARRRPKVGAEVEVVVDELTHTGDGIARLDGYILFVRGALPKERVRVKVAQANDRFGRATLLSVLEPSPKRATPRCRHFGVCGRCSLQHLDYREQLKVKHRLLANELERALPGVRLPLRPMRGVTDPWGTRNKAHFVVGERDGKPVLGHFAANSKKLVPIEECPVHHSAANRAATALVEALGKHHIRPFLESSGKGIAKHIVVRASSSANEAIALLVATTERVPAAAAIAQETMAAAPTTVGVHLHRNPLPGPVVLGSQFVPLAGKDRIVERIAGIDFQLSPTAFFQTAAGAAADLVRLVLQAVPPDARHVLDLYSGIGLFSLPLAKRGLAVLGIEQNAQAVEDARASAMANGIDGCEFQAGKTEELLKELPRERKFDVVVLDPPRDGAPDWVLRLIAHRVRPRTIIDVSCDPGSLARDLSLLRRLGYDIESIEPLDMFPHTMQIEAVAVLSRRPKDGVPTAGKQSSARPRGPIQGGRSLRR